jgi:hypothetical protein
MFKYRQLALVIGKWQSPKHSKQKEFDDSHEVKEMILKKIKEHRKQQGLKPFDNYTGKNPNIGITKDGKISLEGVKVFKRNNIVTDLFAKDYFILSTTKLSASNQIEISLCDMLTTTNKLFENQSFEILKFHKLAIISDDDSIKNIISWCIESFDNRRNVENILVVFYDHGSLLKIKL